MFQTAATAGDWLGIVALQSERFFRGQNHRFSPLPVLPDWMRTGGKGFQRGERLALWGIQPPPRPALAKNCSRKFVSLKQTISFVGEFALSAIAIKFECAMICDIKSMPEKSIALKPSLSREHEPDATLLSSMTQLGMARFFTPENLERYRTLASERLNPDQRRMLIQALGQEMKALRAESQSPR